MRQLKRDIWPYAIALHNADEESKSITEWCTETVGYRFRDWYSYSVKGHNRVYAFKDEDTLLVFKLKWGNYARQTI